MFSRLHTALFSALALLLPLCGCRTYLGYDREDAEMAFRVEIAGRKW